MTSITVTNTPEQLIPYFKKGDTSFWKLLHLVRKGLITENGLTVAREEELLRAMEEEPPLEERVAFDIEGAIAYLKSKAL